jgi:hypothetical protein
MILSVHLADIGRARALRLQRMRLASDSVDGLRYSEITTLAPLGPRLMPAPSPGQVGLIAAWEDEAALDAFLDGHPLAAQLAGGWHVRLQPMRIVGAWPELTGVYPQEEQPMAGEEPVAVLTLGRLRLTQAPRFLRASAAAEGLAIVDPGLVTSTGLARLPRLVATFSLWNSTSAMRAYVQGQGGPAHRDAVQAHAARPFHHHSAFLRMRPVRAHGTWEGREPLASAQELGAQRVAAQPTAAEAV